MHNVTKWSQLVSVTDVQSLFPYRFKLFESKGVKFALGTAVEELVGNEEHLTTVALKNGDSLSADILVVGIGIELFHSLQNM